MFSGSALTFAFAVVIILVWAITGPFFHFSDTWQLVINTGTTIITFLMVFLIQNAQNRDARALHLKLDELILSSSRARNHMMDLERLTDKQLERLQEEFNRLCADDPEDRREAVQRVADDERQEAQVRSM